MRLHLLQVTAFEPFAETETVDFGALGDAGLFLLHGETGAGKSSILDAVCFAFYGGVPGTRGAAPRLRSDHSAPQLRTEVALEVTLCGRRLRITRSPRQQRPKLRGAGTTEEPPRARLEVLGDDGEWNVLADRAEAVAHELEPLLGLTQEQFCQVVLLPQGEFARFLHASSDEREKILRMLFAAERYTEAERWLSERRREADAAVSDGLALISDVASRAAELCDEEPPEEWPQEPVRLAEWLAERIVLAEAGRTLAEDSRRRALDARDAAAEALGQGRQLEERRARHRSALDDLARLERGRGEREAAEGELAAGRRAAPVEPLARRALVQRERAVQLARVAGDALRRAEAAGAAEAAEAAGKADPHGRTDRAAETSTRNARARAAELREGAAALAPLLEAEAHLVEGEGSLRELEAQIARAEGELGSAQDSLAASAAGHDGLTRHLDEAQAAAAAQPGLEAAAELAHGQAEAGERRDGLVVALAEARKRRAGALERELSCRAEWLDARERRLEDIAAELAGALEEGQPCRVCGSTAHPAPARGGPGERVDAEHERGLQQAHEQASAERELLTLRASELERELSAARALAGDGALEALRRALAQAQAALELCAGRAGRLEQLRSDLAEHERRVEHAHQAISLLSERIAALRAERDTRARVVERERETVREARHGFPSITARLARMNEAAASWEEAAEALELAAAERRAGEEALAGAVQEAQSQGFATLEEALAAVAPPERVAELQEQIDRYDEERARLRGLAEDRELIAAARAPAPDLEGLQDARRQAEAALELAQRELGQAVERSRALRRREADLAERLEALEPLLDRRRLVREVAGLVDGSSAANRLNMRLASYVLSARLEQVAEAASARLERMSGGRYVLTHCDERIGRARRAGLGLQVLDGWTGRERAPGSLSGGETFQASLSLALGLADVVEAESGGARLETLFVDEGFGSLGDRALDDTLDVLDGLREGGRAVGLISHVSEMRQRIPARLHVAKGQRGSRIAQ